MARKRKSTSSKDQLSFFDVGLDGSKRQLVPVQERAPAPLVPVEAIPPLVPISVEEADGTHAQTLHGGPPSFFERASYEHYLRLKAETYGFARVSVLVVLILIGVALLGVRVSEAGLGPLRVTFFRHSHLVGLLGWLTILSAGWTLIRSVQMVLKERDCGLFYQRVLQFSGNPIIVLVGQLFSVLFVAVFLGIIAITWLLARNEMLAFATYIIKGILLMFDPWAPVVTPEWR